MDHVLVETLNQVVVVPTAVVQRGPNGTFAYVVDADSKAVVRPITVGMLDDTRAVISDGLKSDERVVTTGFTRLSNGTRVNVQAGDGQPPPDAAPTTSEGPATPVEGRPKREGAANPDGKRRFEPSDHQYRRRRRGDAGQRHTPGRRRQRREHFARGFRTGRPHHCRAFRVHPAPGRS